MKFTFALILLVGLAWAEVQTHYYNTGICEVRTPSEYSVRFEETSCYRIREVDSSCEDRWECLRQDLEWNDFETCWAQNGSMTIKTGSFQVLTTATGNFRRDYSANDCTGSYTQTQLVDSCEAGDCGQTQVTHFPIVVPREDDSEELKAGDIAGITLGSLAILVVCVCGCVIILSCCGGALLVIVALVVLLIVFLYGVLNTEDVNSQGQTTIKGRLLGYLNKCWNDMCNKVAGEKMD